MRSRKLHILGACMLAASCGSGGPTITPPTPLNNPPTLGSCPADISLTAFTSQPQPPATFDTPVARDGQPPVTVVCTPASGSGFPVGSTTVTCEATDAASRKASCTFMVVVAPPPRIEKTKFLAFGDSITGGEGSGLTQAFYLPGNYAERLQKQLAARYQDQTISMVNEALGGETAGQAKLRLPGVLRDVNAEVLLLIDGTNDMLGDQSTPAINSAVDALRRMVQDGKRYGSGMRVFLATLPPLKPAPAVSAAAVEAIPKLNDRIKDLARAESVTLVDLYEAVPPSQIRGDGKHPTPEGNETIATTFLKAIMATIEVKPPALSQSLQPARAIR